MKENIISLTVLCICLMLILASCSNGNEKVNSCNHDWKEATCVDAKECLICGATSGKKLGHNLEEATCTDAERCSRCNTTFGTALGHTTDTGTCERCGENFSVWELGEYTDEFKQPTGKKYLATDLITGTFSNSATTNSDLWAILQIDKDGIGIMLWEYCRNLVKGTFDYEYYDITILDDNGTKHYFTGTIYQGGTRIYFKEADETKVIALLKSNDSIKIYLESTKYSISKYLFTVDTKGFSTLYSKI